MISFFKRAQSAEDGDRSGKLRLILIIGGALLGIILLLFGSGTLKSAPSDETPDTNTTAAEDAMRQYQTELETRIKKLCESVNGVGEVTVVVMLETGFEDVYATEENNGDTEYVIVGSGSSANALFLTRAAPTVAGVGVVCSGGNNPTVQKELSSLLCATLRLPSNRVYITASK